MRDDVHVPSRILLVQLDAKAVIDVTVRPHGRMDGLRRNVSQLRACRLGEQKATGVDEDEAIVGAEGSDVREARDEVTPRRDLFRDEPRRHRLRFVDRVAVR